MAAEESHAPEDRSLVGTRAVDLAVSVMLFAFALVLGWDSWRIGMSWAPDGPQAGYFPFYLAVLLAGASVYGFVTTFLARQADASFVGRDQIRRVLQVFVPTLLFVLAVDYLGLYVASFILIAGFMRFIGRIALWKALLTAVLFTVGLFMTFQIAFNVIMPKGPLEAAFGY